MFTGPSLKAMLHYSVNTYNDRAVYIHSPFAEDIMKKANNPTTAPGGEEANPVNPDLTETPSSIDEVP
jgi:hypothetical protein